MKKFLLTLVLSGVSAFGFAQGSCASPMNIGTPTSTQSCITFSKAAGLVMTVVPPLETWAGSWVRLGCVFCTTITLGLDTARNNMNITLGLDTYYILAKLKYGVEMANRQNVVSQAFYFGLLEPVLQHLEEQNGSEQKSSEELKQQIDQYIQEIDKCIEWLQGS